jgi:Ca2+-binding RTX toxin-like protein
MRNGRRGAGAKVQVRGSGTGGRSRRGTAWALAAVGIAALAGLGALPGAAVAEPRCSNGPADITIETDGGGGMTTLTTNGVAVFANGRSCGLLAPGVHVQVTRPPKGGVPSAPVTIDGSGPWGAGGGAPPRIDLQTARYESTRLVGTARDDRFTITNDGVAMHDSTGAQVLAVSLMGGRTVTVDGAAGSDQLAASNAARVAGGVTHPLAIVLSGGPGADVLSGSPFADWLDGGSGADTLRGGPGADTLVGGPGRDQLLGGDGADDFRARDRALDLVDGGPGSDRCLGPSRDRADRLVSIART